MLKKKLLSVAGLFYMLCFTISLFTTDVHAQNDSAGVKNNDKNIADRRGVSESLAGGDKPKEKFNPDTGRIEKAEEEVDPNKPTSFQMGLGLGSIPVAYIILKFL